MLDSAPVGKRIQLTKEQLKVGETVFCPAQTERIHDLVRDFGFLKVKNLGSRLGVKTASLQFCFGDSETLWALTIKWDDSSRKYVPYTQVGAFADPAEKGALYHTLSTLPGDSGAPL